MLNIGDSVQIPGCSTKKRLLETTSGCDSFDTLLGGALVNSSIVLIDEYRSRCYGSYLVRSFLAEGLHYGHRCFVADPSEDVSETILKVIPTRKAAEDDQKKEIPSSPGQADNDMKIAWRYGNVKQVTSEIGPSGNQYDFSKHLENSNVDVYNEEIPSFSGLYKILCEVVQKEEAHTKSTGRGGPKKNLLRVVLKNIHLNIWEDYESLGRFLCCLRSLARSSYAVIYIVANSHRMPNDTWRQLESAADTHIQHLGTAHGYFHLKSLPRLMSAGTHTPPILDLIFEASSKKGFQIRVMHLPPAFDEPAPGQQKATACQNIDF
ncbi:hypothetical protein L5515_012017 [Caenorhabditis briggsae]|uniref:Elongator complex protein 4 n=1 Tax=Caenorhabditis briggsae TaxID=6238 RepID=A0AAE9EWF9_CAEBR|nr:hypothetical protein L5515_012017 [Caenorhabditis briggsae]